MSRKYQVVRLGEGKWGLAADCIEYQGVWVLLQQSFTSYRDVVNEIWRLRDREKELLGKRVAAPR